MKTPKPFTYTIDYGGMAGHVANAPRFIAEVAAAPPHLLHIGHDVPFPNTYGPIDQTADGKLRRLSGAEAADRTERIRDMLQRLRQAGVKIMVPYICNQTVAGDPEKRLGVWDVYDHWDDYADMGIGPRPAVDPMEWLARESNGRPHFNYEMRHAGFLRYGVHRWAPCCNNPHYHEWQRVVVSQIARVGYDGVFVDNCILNCYCPYCEEKFRQYLTHRYTRRERMRRFGTGDVKELSLAHRGSRLAWVKEEPTFREFLRETFTDEELVRWLGTRDLEAAHLEEWGNGLLWGRAHDYQRWMESRYSASQLEQMIGAPDLSAWGLRDETDRLLWAETKRFWAQSICENFRLIQEIGRQAGQMDRFLLLPNWGEMENLDSTEFREEIAHDIAEWAPATDVMMYEEGNSPGMVAPGLYLDHLVQHKYALAQGVNAAVLPYGRQHEGSVELGNAQAAAGGGGAYIQPGNGFPAVRARYTEFFNRYGDLLAKADPYADIAVACLMEELHLENPTHLEWVYRITRYLADQHVLFEIVTEKQMNAEGLAPWKALLLPATRYLSRDQVAAVRDFASRGGIVVMMGEVATHDDCARRRKQPALKRLLSRAREKAGVYVSPAGHLFARTPDPLIGPYRVSREEGLQFANYSEASINVPTGKVGVVFELDRMIGIDRYDAAGELIPRLEGALGRRLRLTDPAAPGVRFTAFHKEVSGAETLLLHVLNYNVPLREHPRGTEVEPVENLAVSLHLPADWAAAEVKLLRPDRDEETVPTRVEQGAAAFTIPRLDVYALAVIRRPS